MSSKQPDKPTQPSKPQPPKPAPAPAPGGPVRPQDGENDPGEPTGPGKKP